MLHRLMFELCNGPIPKGRFICHHCDNPACVNPDHLFAGTHDDNMHDRSQKGRAAVKLSLEKARAIRDSSKSVKELAKEYGVSQTMIRDIWAGKYWAAAGGAIRPIGKPGYFGDSEGHRRSASFRTY